MVCASLLLTIYNFFTKLIDKNTKLNEKNAKLTKNFKIRSDPINCVKTILLLIKSHLINNLIIQFQQFKIID